MKMNFNVIVVDPPWSFSDQLKMSSVKRGASSNYKTMSIQELCDLPVKELADPDGCVLALWVVGSMLEDGIKVMRAWGFEPKQTYCWIKTKKQHSLNNIAFKDIISSAKKLKSDPLDFVKKASFVAGDWLLSFGMGHAFRQSHELCLIGINNTKIYKKIENKSQRSVCFSENKGHSTKPENLQDSLDKMIPNSNKIEIFARRIRPGWTCIGNEVCDDEDIRVSINNILNA